jgi:PAS domain S-box-containing protein
MITPKKITPGKVENYLSNLSAFNKAVTSLQESISIISAETLKPLYASCSLLQILGYSEKQIQAFGEDWGRKITHPDDYLFVSNHIRNYIVIPPHTRSRVVFRMRDSNGRWRQIESVSHALVGKSKPKAVTHIMTISRDITVEDVEQDTPDAQTAIDHRCSNCKKLLGRRVQEQEIEIKCVRCGEYNHIIES